MAKKKITKTAKPKVAAPKIAKIKRTKKKKNTGKKKTKFAWSWPAFLLGPLWYALHHLWIHTVAMITILILSGFVLYLPLLVYCGLKFDEDLEYVKNKTLEP
jgi:uncharacterized protein DUF2628